MAGGGHRPEPDLPPGGLARGAAAHRGQSLPRRACTGEPGGAGRELLGLCPAFDCLDEYRARCFVPGHWVTVCTGTESYAAKAVAIDDAGRLIVAREGSRTEALCHGEVSIRPSPLAVK